MPYRFVAATLILAAAGTIGCRIDSEKHAEGDNVKIATPFGGMQVKTNSTDVLSGIGLPPYPGATLVRKQKDNGEHDSGSADINMSFGSFQLKVKAVEYHSDDSPAQVMAFYKKALARFGNVIQCDNKRPVGTPTRTDEGLTCNEDNPDAGNNGIHVSNSEDDAKMQLKAGSKKHQHIVDINPDHSGTKFGLVSLDLPTDFHIGNDSGDDRNSKSDREQKQ